MSYSSEHELTSLPSGSLEDYTLKSIIAQGSFGTVHSGHLNDSLDERLDLLALKVCSMSKLKKLKYCEYNMAGGLVRFNGLDKFLKECNMLKSLKHPNIIPYVQAFMDDDEDVAVLVMPLVWHGPIMTYHERTGCYTFNTRAGSNGHAVNGDGIIKYFRDIVQAVSHLHAHNICHRDIKPANLLLTSQNTIQLCDFGSAEYYASSSNPGGMVSNTVGTPANWAPEALFPDKYATDVGLDLYTDHDKTHYSGGRTAASVNEKDHKVGDDADCTTKISRFSAYGLDMWSLGVVLYIMFYKHHPFFQVELSEMQLYERIYSYDPFSAEYDGTSDTHEHCDHNGGGSTDGCAGAVVVPNAEECAIIEGLLQKEPTMRYGIDTLMEMDPFR